MRSVFPGFALLGLLLLPGSGAAQDPVQVDPDHYKLEFANDHVRVLRITYGPREKSVLHDHSDGVAVFLTDHHVRFTFPDEGVEEVHAKAGESVWHPGGKHLPENLADEPFELLLIELKKKPARSH